jgi:hypothetical protein
MGNPPLLLGQASLICAFVGHATIALANDHSGVHTQKHLLEHFLSNLDRQPPHVVIGESICPRGARANGSSIPDRGPKFIQVQRSLTM